jgi:hypothetical protein
MVLCLVELESRHSMYSDANWGGYVDRKSISGTLRFSVMILCTGRARSRAASLCPLQRQNMWLLGVVIWLRGVLFNLNFKQMDPTVILDDNTAAIK